MSPAAENPPAVLVLTGGLIHLVHQLAVVRALPELVNGDHTAPAAIGVLVTGVLRRDPAAVASLHARIEPWLERLRQLDPQGFRGLQLLRDDEAAAARRWSIACLNNQWVVGQRQVIERLALTDQIGRAHV